MFAKLKDVFQALERDQIVPYFQPIVDLRTGGIRGFEVLARWIHPERGVVLPESFIPIVEDSGLIGELTHQLLGKAFAAARLLPSPLFLAVNVSPRQMRHLTFPQQIRGCADDAGFPLERLTIEITETALIDNLTDASKILNALKAMGCKVALDDFGTGYSCLQHLRALPIDKLKIDRSFVASMTTKRESRKIVAAVLGLGHSLGLTTVGEGVENDEQAGTLLRLGCDYVQGWLYGRPLPAESLPGVLAAEPHATSVFGAQGGPQSAVSVLEALPAQRLAQMQAIYDGSPVGLCFVDRNLRYINLNERLAKMNGLAIGEHLGRTIPELFPTWFPNYEPYLIRALKGEAVGGVEIVKTHVRAGQRDQVILASYQPVWEEGGEVIGISIAVLDMTEHTRVKEEVRESTTYDANRVEANLQVPWSMDSQGKTEAERALDTDDQDEQGCHEESWLAGGVAYGRSGRCDENDEGCAPHGNSDRYGVPREGVERPVAMDAVPRFGAFWAVRRDHQMVWKYGGY